MLREFLRKVPLFDCLDEAELESLAALTVARTYDKGQMIILADDVGESFFMIRQGEVKISIVHEDGREMIFSMLGPGQVFGELALLDGRPRSANVVALRDSELVSLRRRDFLQLLCDKPGVATAMLAELASRLRLMDEKIEGLALWDVTSRVSRTLVQLAADLGVETAEGMRLDNRPTHQQLANMSGTTRETVTRVLNRLEEQGYVRSCGRSLVIVRDEGMGPLEQLHPASSKAAK